MPASSGPRPTLLIVDDIPENLALLGEILSLEFRVLAAPTGQRALEIAHAAPALDLILLDLMMPEMSGYEVLDALKRRPGTAEVPVIFLTALGDAEAEERGLELGAVDYVTKPIRPRVLIARIRAQLELRRARDLLRDQNCRLEAEVSRRMAENDLTQLATIRALAHLAETRDPETGNHLQRTQAYVQLLAEKLQHHPRFSATLTPRYIRLLARSAPLHDIGKVGVPDHILLKPGALSPEEWEVMKMHAVLGAEALEHAERDIAQPLEFLGLAKEIARWHHERWDGRGYPDGLAGDAIPVSARLMAVADVFDALVTYRVYKPTMPFEQAREVIALGRSAQFDPDVVDAFLEAFSEFVAVAQLHRDRR